VPARLPLAAIFRENVNLNISARNERAKINKIDFAFHLQQGQQLLKK
jgi:hypothetical protein